MRAYTIASGKGGVGKTTIAANLGIALAQNARTVLLFDADLSLANLDVIMGVKPEHTLKHVLSDLCTISEAVTPCGTGVDLVAGGSAVGNLMRSGKKRIGKFIEQLHEVASKYDVVIFDTSAGLDAKVVTFCRIADEILAVTTPDPAAVLDTYALAKVVFRSRPEAAIRVVVNGVQNETEGKAVFAKLDAVVAQFLGKSLVYGGVMRQDPGVAECVRRRTPFAFSHPGLAASIDMNEIARSLIKAEKHLGESEFFARAEAFLGLQNAA
jgi:flagellar biosynthesis protein FlhG